MKLIRTGFAMILAVGAGCAQKTYTLQLNPKQGETYSYTTTVTGPTNMSMTMSMKAAKVDPGQVSFESKIGSMSIGGQQMPPAVSDMMSKMVITVTEDRSGHMLNTSVSGVPDALAKTMQGQEQPSAATFPDHPVKVGDTWTGETNMQGKKVAVNYKLAAVDTINGMQAAEIEATPSSSGTIKFAGPMKVAVELATGMPISMNFDAEANGQKMSVSMVRG